MERVKLGYSRGGVSSLAACFRNKKVLTLEKHTEMRELEKWIVEELPIDGEWWKDGHEKYIEAAKKMNAFGVPIVIIKEIFTNLYSAMADEFE